MSNVANETLSTMPLLDCDLCGIWSHCIEAICEECDKFHKLNLFRAYKENAEFTD